MLIRYNGEVREIVSTGSCSACAKKAGKSTHLEYVRQNSYYLSTGMPLYVVMGGTYEVSNIDGNSLLLLTTTIDGQVHYRFSKVE